jgi:hypothetical protein
MYTRILATYFKGVVNEEAKSGGRRRRQSEGTEHVVTIVYMTSYTAQVKVVLQVFDLLFINGKSVLSQSLRTRRTLLRNAFSESVGQFHFARGADHVENGDTEPIEVPILIQRF